MLHVLYWLIHYGDLNQYLQRKSHVTTVFVFADMSIDDTYTTTSTLEIRHSTKNEQLNMHGK